MTAVVNGSVTPSVTSSLSVRQRPLQPLDQRRVEGEREQERGDDRDQPDHEPVPQLAQMLDERRLFVRPEASRGDPPESPHPAVLLVRRRSPARAAATSRCVGSAGSAGGSSVAYGRRRPCRRR